MSMRNAECIFCGQLIQIEAEGELTPGQAREEAAMICQCPEAVEYQEEKHRREKALRNVRILFGEEAPPERRAGEGAVNILLAAVDEIYGGEVSKITLQLWGGAKAIVSRNSEGKITVERTETKKQKLMG